MSTFNTEVFAQLQATVKGMIKGCYTLPKVEGKKNVYVCPISGGIDSFSTAFVTAALFPDTPITYMHTDTGIEANGTAQALDAFEQITGRQIMRVNPKKDLLTQIEDNGNFLPSARQRSCTANAKIAPANRFYEMLLNKLGKDDTVIFNLVGIRADESQRKGVTWSNDNIASSYPLLELGLVKADVNKLVDATIGIPSYYFNKSRSGCAVCIFSRRSEIISAWNTDTPTLERAAKMEEVPATIARIYNAMPASMSEITDIQRNHMSFYRPSWLLGNPAMDCEGKRGDLSNKNCKGTVDMFRQQSTKLFVAVEYEYYDGAYGYEPMVGFERIITYSTTLGGLKISLKHFWLHRLQTKTMHQASDERALNRSNKIAIIEMEIDDFENEIPPTPEGIYTWQSDRKPLYAIRKTVAVIEHILLCEGFEQDLKSTNPQFVKDAQKAIPRIQKRYGQILNSSQYTPPKQEELVTDMDITDAPMACIACSK